jgi:hypothetical protein
MFHTALATELHILSDALGISQRRRSRRIKAGLVGIAPAHAAASSAFHAMFMFFTARR